MTNDKHTPGPWTYTPTAGNHDFLIYSESEPTSRDIAIVRDFDEANARLISAAPELLNALQNACNVLAGIATGDLKTITADSPALAQCRAALAKAKGL